MIMLRIDFGSGEASSTELKGELTVNCQIGGMTILQNEVISHTTGPHNVHTMQYVTATSMSQQPYATQVSTAFTSAKDDPYFVQPLRKPIDAAFLHKYCWCLYFIPCPQAQPLPGPAFMVCLYHHALHRLTATTAAACQVIALATPACTDTVLLVAHASAAAGTPQSSTCTTAEATVAAATQYQQVTRQFNGCAAFNLWIEQAAQSNKVDVCQLSQPALRTNFWSYSKKNCLVVHLCQQPAQSIASTLCTITPFAHQ